MSRPCELRIETPDLRIDLKGEAAFVRAGYMALRVEILSRLQAARATADSPRSSDVGDLSAIADAATPSSEQASRDYLWVYRCNDLYNKVYVLERRQFQATGLGRVVDLSRVRRVYIESAHAGELGALVPPGKTLWSELTGLGHERLRTS